MPLSEKFFNRKVIMKINIFYYKCLVLYNLEIIIVYGYFRNIGSGIQNIFCGLFNLILTMS